MSNYYDQWRAMFAAGPLQVGTVTAWSDGVATIQLPSGGILRALGEATTGQMVYVRDGAIIGPAPDLPVDSGEV